MTSQATSDARAIEEEAVASPPGFSGRYLWVALAILFLINLANYMDRFIMSILIEPVRKEFGLSDTQAGLLTGLGFSLIYSLLILPVARLSDRFSRKKILVAAVAAWSLLTTLCGAASSFATLLLARAGVGVGEAAGLPASHSLASDYFPPHRRAMALTVIGLGGAVGSTVGLIIGGFVSEHYGWRHAFWVAGLPGLLLAAIIALFLREPLRGGSDGKVVRADEPAAPFFAVVKLLLRRKAYVHIVAAITLGALSMMGAAAWFPTFFMRVHHVPAGQLSLWLTVSHVAGSFVGTMFGGWLCTRYFRPDGLTLLRVMGGAFLLSPLLVAAVCLVPGAMSALVLNIPLSFVMSMWLPAYYTSQQELAGARYRATASAFGLIFFNLIGSGLGPLIVGQLSDLFAPSLGEGSLRYAILLSFIFCLWGLLHLCVAARTMGDDVAAARA
jgi:predicted MFS family arabinose efflux permease